MRSNPISNRCMGKFLHLHKQQLVMIQRDNRFWNLVSRSQVLCRYVQHASWKLPRKLQRCLYVSRIHLKKEIRSLNYRRRKLNVMSAGLFTHCWSLVISLKSAKTTGIQVHWAKREQLHWVHVILTDKNQLRSNLCFRVSKTIRGLKIVDSSLGANVE